MHVLSYCFNFCSFHFFIQFENVHSFSCILVTLGLIILEGDVSLPGSKPTDPIGVPTEY